MMQYQTVLHVNCTAFRWWQCCFEVKPHEEPKYEMDMCNKFKVNKRKESYVPVVCCTAQETLQQIASQQADLLQQVDVNVFELEKERHALTEQYKKVVLAVAASTF